MTQKCVPLTPECKSECSHLPSQKNEFHPHTFTGLSCIGLKQKVGKRGLTNECMYQSCGNGVCINTDGRYQGQCHERYSITSDGTCQDTDECQNVSCFTIHCQNIVLKINSITG